MNAFHFPWLLASITVAMGGAAWVRQQQDTARAYIAAVISAIVVLLLVCAAESISALWSNRESQSTR